MKNIEHKKREFLEELIDEVALGKTDNLDSYIKEKKEISIDIDTYEYILAKIEQSKISREDIFRISQIFSQDSKIEYLKTKPSPDRARLVIQTVNRENIGEILREINDDFYTLELMKKVYKIKGGTLNAIIENTKDLYLRETIFNKFLRGYSIDEDEIKQYAEIKRALLELETEEERVEFLIELQLKTNETNSDRITNKAKKYLLPYIENKENRQKVIKSMQSKIDDELKEYVDLVKKMIYDYFLSQGEIQQEMKEELDIVFSSYRVERKDLSNKQMKVGHLTGKNVVRGVCRHVQKQILLTNQKIQPREIIKTLIHEYGHAFAQENNAIEDPIEINFNGGQGKELDEGMAETLGENVINNYFSKNKDVKINGETIDFDLPYIAPSYKELTRLAKILLYQLEAKDEDFEELKQYFLGDKSEFYEKVNIKEIFNLSKKSNKKIKLETSNELIKILYNRIKDIFHKSRYTEKNTLFYMLNILGKYLNSEEQYLDIDRLIDLAIKADEIISKSKNPSNEDFDEIFENRDLEEISKEEIELFGEILSQYFPGHDFLNKNQYLKHKMEQRKEKEKKNEGEER